MRLVFSVIRLTIFFTWSFFSIITCFFFSLILLSKKPTVFFAARMWAPVALPIMGARIKIECIEPLKENIPYVVMANHSSYLDIPALMSALPLKVHFIAKKEFKTIPFLGWYLMLADTILIDRKNSVKAKESLADAAELIHQGRHVALFPEGTRTKTGTIEQFKKGGFHLAHDAGAHIIPVHIKGTFLIWPNGGFLKIKPGKVIVTIGKPIAPEEYNKLEMNERREFVRGIIAEL